VGPETFKQSSSHISIGDNHRESRNHATAGGVVGMDTKYHTYENHDANVNMRLSFTTYVYCILITIQLNREAAAYEIPKETGLYVPTAVSIIVVLENTYTGIKS
jgi:hypothetical protein